MKALIASIATLIMSAPAQAVSNVELCQKLVTQKAGEGRSQAAPLAELKGLLLAAGGATAVFEVKLDGLQPALDFLDGLTKSGGELEVPVRFFSGNSFLFIAQGPSAGFAKLEKRLREAGLTDRTTFHILSAKSLKPLTAPREILQTEEDIERARKGKDPFAVYTADQVVFMIPREVIGQFDPVEMKRRKIVVGRIYRPPHSWTDWLKKRSAEFRGKTVIANGEWAAVSSQAFALLQEISGAENDGTSPEMRALNRRILDLLEEPQSPRTADMTGERPPRPESALNLSKEARKAMMSYLSAHRARTKLNEAEGIERSFLALAKLAPTERSAEAYRKAIRKIGLARWEYSSLMHDQTSSIERVSEAWLAFLKTMRNPYADNPINARNLQAAIKQLPE